MISCIFFYVQVFIKLVFHFKGILFQQDMDMRSKGQRVNRQLNHYQRLYYKYLQFRDTIIYYKLDQSKAQNIMGLCNTKAKPKINQQTPKENEQTVKSIMKDDPIVNPYEQKKSKEIQLVIKRNRMKKATLADINESLSNFRKEKNLKDNQRFLYLEQYVIEPQLQFQFNLRDIATKEDSYLKIKIIEDSTILNETIRSYISPKDKQEFKAIKNISIPIDGPILFIQRENNSYKSVFREIPNCSLLELRKILGLGTFEEFCLPNQEIGIERESQNKMKIRNVVKDNKMRIKLSDPYIYDGQHSGKYWGEMKDKKRHGYGQFLFDGNLNVKSYIGQWKNGIIYGSGIVIFNDGRKHNGQFKDSKKMKRFLNADNKKRESLQNSSQRED